MLRVRRVRSDEPPADRLVAAMVAEVSALYGDITARGAPTATPDELWEPGGSFVVVEQDGAAVAGGGVKSLAPDIGEIKRMYVVPDARGRGLSRTLLAALEDEARRLGYPRVRLDTGPQQPGARRLYEGAGYRSIPDYNANHAANFWGEKDLSLGPLDVRDPLTAERVLAVQRAAYAAEADLIGFDGIPPLHETLEELRASGERWLGRWDGPQLVGALAYEEPAPETIEITRLIVDPAAHRRGHATALLDALDTQGPAAVVLVSTASANVPALALYEQRGFWRSGEETVAPGVRITRLQRSR